MRPNMRIPIGKVGEHDALRVVWPGIAAAWQDVYGDGVFQLSCKRYGDETPYPAVVAVDGKDVAWVVTDADCAREGVGYCELSYIVGGAVAKSVTWVTLTFASLTGGLGEPPEAEQAWVDQVLMAGAAAQVSREGAELAQKKAEEAQAAAEAAQLAAETAQRKAEDAQRKAETAKQKAETAQAAAETAQKAAETAQEKAETAQSKSEEAQKKAETAQAAAEAAQKAAEDAQKAAEAARQEAQTAQAAAEAAQRKAETAQAEAEAARDVATAAASAASSSATAAAESAKTADQRATDAQQIYDDIVEYTAYTDEAMFETMCDCGLIDPVGADAATAYTSADGSVYLF